MGYYAKILYWPNKNKNFGHVAIEIFDSQEKYQPIYVSFGKHGYKSYDDDALFHGRNPYCVELPINTQDFSSLLQGQQGINFKNFPPKNYSRLDQNCAHRVRNILVDLGYLSAAPASSFGLTPHTVFNQSFKLACEKFAENIKLHSREKILEDDWVHWRAELLHVLDNYRHYLNAKNSSDDNITDAYNALMDNDNVNSQEKYLQEIIKISVLFPENSKPARIFKDIIQHFPEVVKYKAAVNLAADELEKSGKTDEAIKLRAQASTVGETLPNKTRLTSLEFLKKSKEESTSSKILRACLWVISTLNPLCYCTLFKPRFTPLEKTAERLLMQVKSPSR